MKKLKNIKLLNILFQIVNGIIHILKYNYKLFIIYKIKIINYYHKYFLLMVFVIN